MQHLFMNEGAEAHALDDAVYVYQDPFQDRVSSAKNLVIFPTILYALSPCRAICFFPASRSFALLFIIPHFVLNFKFLQYFSRRFFALEPEPDAREKNKRLPKGGTS
jgi:hypothetical protein